MLKYGMRKLKIEKKMKKSKENIEEIINLYKSGLTRIQISKIKNISRHTVGVILKENNVQKDSKISIQEIINLYNTGLSCKQIEKTAELSSDIIRKILKENNITLRSNSKKSKLNEEEIRDLYEKGKSIKEISKLAGVSVNSIRYKIKKEIKIIKKEKSKIPIEKIIKLYKNGKSISEIAKISDISPPTVKRKLIENNIELNLYKNNRSRISTEEIIYLYETGLSSIEIAKIAGISFVAILNKLKNNNINKKEPKDYRKHNYELIRKDYDNGLSLKKLTEIYKINPSTIWYILKKTGPTRPRESLKGKDHPCWKEFKKLSGNYVMMNYENIREHRFNIEKEIKRKLFFWEEVHHINGIRNDNKLENLVVIPNTEHVRFHTFLKHRNLEINKINLEKICRKESDYYYRFTKKDFKLATINYPLTEKSFLSQKKLQKKCKCKNCINFAITIGLCSKHYQRKRAKKRGYWISGGGRKAKIIESWL